MKSHSIRLKSLALAVGMTLASSAALADHNSIWGEGWATDAMGKHAEAVDRIEELGLGTDTSQAGSREISVEGNPRNGESNTATTDLSVSSDRVSAQSVSDAAATTTEPAVRARQRVEARYGLGFENRIERPQRMERPERPERPERMERPERPERPSMPDRGRFGAG